MRVFLNQVLVAHDWHFVFYLLEWILLLVNSLCAWQLGLGGGDITEGVPHFYEWIATSMTDYLFGFTRIYLLIIIGTYLN